MTSIRAMDYAFVDLQILCVCIFGDHLRLLVVLNLFDENKKRVTISSSTLEETMQNVQLFRNTTVRLASIPNAECRIKQRDYKYQAKQEINRKFTEKINQIKHKQIFQMLVNTCW